MEPFRELPQWDPENLEITSTVPGTVSVVIPAFNALETLMDAVASCFAQTRRVDEVVIVDDGSTDETRQLLGVPIFSPCFVGAVRHPVNLGVSAARNHGARLATGEFLIYLDADDIMPPGRVEQVMEEFAAGADVVYGQKEYFTGNDWTKRRRRSIVALPTKQNILGSGFGASTVSVRRAVHTEYDLWWDERMSVAEDAEFLVAALQESMRVCCSFNVYCWVRESSGSLTHRGDWTKMRRYIGEKHEKWLAGFYKHQG
jgi:glycosyltransferase involved in cell wall biosynthesis